MACPNNYLEYQSTDFFIDLGLKGDGNGEKSY